MRITLSYLLRSILSRFGALLLFFALAVVSLMALLYISRAPTPSHLTTMLAVAIFLGSIAWEFAAAPAAWRSWFRLVQFFRAVLSIQPSPSGPFVVGDTRVALAPLPSAHLAPS